MTDTTAKTSFEFTEEMKGYLSPGQTAFQDGYDQGKTDGHYFMFHLTIQSDDLDTFLNNDRHQAAAIGWVEGDLVAAGALSTKACSTCSSTAPTPTVNKCCTGCSLPTTTARN